MACAELHSRLNDHAEPPCSVSPSDPDCHKCAPCATLTELSASEVSTDLCNDTSDDDDHHDLLSHVYASYFGSSAVGAAADCNVIVSVSADGADTTNQGGKVRVTNAAPAVLRFDKPRSSNLYSDFKPIAASARTCSLRDRGK